MRGRIEGSVGVAELLPTVEELGSTNPDHAATLGHYLLTRKIPDDRGFPQIVIALVHLRPVDGQSRPPSLRFPGASHEFLVMEPFEHLGPLTPSRIAELFRQETPLWQTVLYAEQVGGATDDQAREVLTLYVTGLVRGRILLHDPLPARVLRRTLEHIKYGGHPSDSVGHN